MIDMQQQLHNSIQINNIGTVGFVTAPNVYISNATNTNIAALSSTLSTTIPASPINSLTITAGGTGFTGNPTLLFYGGNPTTAATATATQTGGSITTVNVTNAGAGYSSVPVVGWNGGGAMVITANITTGLLSSFTITTSPFFTSAPTILISGGGGVTQTTTCTLTAGFISAIALPASTNYPTAPTIYLVGGTGLGALILTPNMYYQLNTISPIQNYPLGTFTTQPTISYNGGGVINITPNMNGGNTIVTGFNITNGGYAGCFASPPTIVLSGSGGYATCTCTLTNGVITGINLPVASGNNTFTAAPTVSVYGGGLTTTTATLNPFNTTVGGYSLYQNIKRLRFDLNQEFQPIRLANGAVIFLEFIRMPALTNVSTCYKNLRVIGAQNITVFDSTQGTTGNPILFTCEGGNTAVNYFLSNTEYSRLPVPPNFLNKGYIEFELDTVLTAANNGNVYTAAQLNDLIIKVVIAEPDLAQTQDNNLAPEYNKTDFQIQRIYNKNLYKLLLLL